MIKAYWLRILICALAGAGLGWILALVTPPQYEGIVQILIDTKQQGGPGRPTTFADDSVNDILEFSRNRNVSTQVEMLTGLGTLQTAAEKVAAETGKPMTPDSELNPLNLQQRVAVVAQNDSDIVTLRVRMSSPELARDVAKEIYAAFEDQNTLLAKKSAEKAIAYLETQKKVVQERVNELDQKDAELRKAFTAPDLQSQIQAEVGVLARLEQDRDSAEIDLETIKGRAQRLRQEYNSLSPMIDASSNDTINPNMQQIEAQLTSARADLKSLLEKYTPEREEVKLIQARIASLEAERAKIKSQIRAGSTKTVNPTRQSIQGQLAEAGAGVVAYQRRLVAAQAAVDQKKTELQRLPEIQKQIQALTRERLTQERIYQGYSERLDSLKIADSGRTSVTSLVTAPLADSRPTSPNLVLNLSLGAVIGLGIGIFWSVATESRRSPIRTLAQLNRLSLQPSYRTIPELRAPFRGLDRAPAESFDALLVNYARSGKKGYMLGIVGTTKNAGATVTAYNVAVSAARSGSRVLVVEFDSSGSIAKRLGKLSAAGVNDKISFYNGSVSVSDSDHSLQIPQNLADEAAKYDLVVFDFLPARASSEAVKYAGELDEVVLLARVGQTRSVDFLQVQQALVDAGCKQLSIVLSRVPEQNDDIALLEANTQDQRALAG